MPHAQLLHSALALLLTWGTTSLAAQSPAPVAPAPQQGRGAVRDAAEFPGTDAGKKIAAAVADLGAGRGIVDALHLSGDQVLSGFTIPPGVTVLLNVGTFTVTGKIIVTSGARLIGVGGHTRAGTVLRAADGFNDNMIELTTTRPHDWWHWGHVEGLILDGNRTHNTRGHCLAVLAPMGESSSVSDLFIFNCAQDGIYMGSPTDPHVAAQAPAHLENIATFNNGRYGFNCDGCSGVIRILGLSGDDNSAALMHVAGYQSLAMTVIGLKSEIKVPGTQDPTALLEAIGTTGVNPTFAFIGGSVMPSHGAAPADVFKIVGPAPVNLHIQDFYVETVTNLINDVATNLIVKRTDAANNGQHIGSVFHDNTRPLYITRSAPVIWAGNPLRVHFGNTTTDWLKVRTDGVVVFQLPTANSRFSFADSNDVPRATVDSTGKAKFDGGVVAPIFQMGLTTPNSSTNPCTAGQMWADANYIYVCVAENKIRRAPLSSF